MKKIAPNKPQQKNSEKNTGKAREKSTLVSDMGIGFKMLDFKSNHVMYGEE